VFSLGKKGGKYTSIGERKGGGINLLKKKKDDLLRLGVGRGKISKGETHILGKEKGLSERTVSFSCQGEVLNLLVRKERIRSLVKGEEEGLPSKGNTT